MMSILIKKLCNVNVNNISWSYYVIYATGSEAVMCVFSKLWSDTWEKNSAFDESTSFVLVIVVLRFLNLHSSQLDLSIFIAPILSFIVISSALDASLAALDIIMKDLIIHTI